jgi:hypothetical protein
MRSTRTARTVRGTACLAFVSAWSIAAHAQDTTAAAARRVADAFFGAAQQQQWIVAAGYLDLEAFEHFFRQRVNEARAAVPPPEITVEEILARQPELPKAVAEWQVSEARKARAQFPFNDFSYEFARVTSFRELAALTPLEAAARWIEAQDPREGYRRAIAASNCDSTIVPMVIDSLPDARPRRTLGAIVVSENVAYVLHTDDASSAIAHEANATMHRPGPTVMTVRRTGAGWRIVPADDLLRFPGSMIGISCEPRQKR